MADGAEGWGMHSSTLRRPPAAACNSGWMDGVFTARVVSWAAPEQRPGNTSGFLPAPQPSLLPAVQVVQGASLGRDFLPKGGACAMSALDRDFTSAQVPVQAANAKAGGLLAASLVTCKPKSGGAAKQEWRPLPLAPTAQPVHKPLTAQCSAQCRASQPQHSQRQAPFVLPEDNGKGGLSIMKADAGHGRRSGCEEEGAAPMDAVAQALADKVRPLTVNLCDNANKAAVPRVALYCCTL